MGTINVEVTPGVKSILHARSTQEKDAFVSEIKSIRKTLEAGSLPKGDTPLENSKYAHFWQEPSSGRSVYITYKFPKHDPPIGPPMLQICEVGDYDTFVFEEFKRLIQP